MVEHTLLISDQCNLKKPCNLCQEKHLQILHNVNVKDNPVRAGHTSLYLGRPADCSRVFLKVIRVLLHSENGTLDTYAVLDDGSERTVLLSTAAVKLGLRGTPEDLPLRTVRQDIEVIRGANVSFKISPIGHTHRLYHIAGAFTSSNLSLADHSYPVSTLQRKYKHLRGLPLESFDGVSPLLLIGSDQTHLIPPIEPVRSGPPGGPAAIKTNLGWTLQGPARGLPQYCPSKSCLLTSTNLATSELLRNVERLWQVDTLPFRSEKLVTRSKEDQEAIALLEDKTVRVNVDGIYRYATPLLRRKTAPHFQASPEAVMPSLRSTERRLMKDPDKAAAYEAEISKLGSRRLSHQASHCRDGQPGGIVVHTPPHGVS